MPQKWHQRILVQLEEAQWEPAAGYSSVFEEINLWRGRLNGVERGALECLWAAAVAYLMLDVAQGDALREEALVQLQAISSG